MFRCLWSSRFASQKHTFHLTSVFIKIFSSVEKRKEFCLAAWDQWECDFSRLYFKTLDVLNSVDLQLDSFNRRSPTRGTWTPGVTSAVDGGYIEKLYSNSTNLEKKKGEKIKECIHIESAITICFEISELQLIACEN